ncbi:porin [Pseudoalteromonas sp. SW0106-04]|uniref:porin n=1 Tax=Pseudoalteromonas sp. SW0106-04 TaxID=1702169 RepID=UPI0006B5D012|nr:porin [Pseudoalteromonas sp. SW0106-04]
MRFAPSALVFAVAAGLPFYASADVNIYGKANVTVQSSDEGEGSFTEIKSNASRLGFKGSEGIADGLDVVYKLEFQVDLSDADSKGDKDNITARNQYVGLKGNFGQIVIGRNDTALKQSQGKVDLFSDLEGDIKNVFKGENRLGDSVTYTSNSLNGFKVIASYIAEDDTDADNGYSVALTYGDKGLKKSNVYAAIAADSEVKGYDILRATVGTKVAGIKLGAMYQTQEPAAGGEDSDGFLVSAAYAIDKTVLKAQYQTMDFAGNDRNAMTAGVDYKFNKSTKLFGFYTKFDDDASADEDYLAVGMEYKF